MGVEIHSGIVFSVRSAAGALLEYYTTTYRASFENCLFYCHIDATTPYFIYVKTGKAQGVQFYKDCTFAAMSTSQAYDMATIFGWQSDDATGHHIFDINCTSVNCTDITGGVNGRLSVYFGVSATTTTATGLAITTT